MTSQDFDAARARAEQVAAGRGDRSADESEEGIIRSGDGSTPAEDDALLRQPTDEDAYDPDVERPGEPWQEKEPPAEGAPWSDMGDREPTRPDRPSDPAEGPDDPDYTR